MILNRLFARLGKNENRLFIGFFPAYNEEASLKKVVLSAKAVLESLNFLKEWEIIIVNDGSQDGTGKLAQKLARNDQRIRVVNHQNNKGYGASLKSGFYNASYPWIAFTDSDGQFDFSEIKVFIKKQSETNADLVIGFIKKYRNRFLKL